MTISNLETAKVYIKRNLISAGVSNRLKWQHLIASHLEALTPILEGLKGGIKDEMGTC